MFRIPKFTIRKPRGLQAKFFKKFKGGYIRVIYCTFTGVIKGILGVSTMAHWGYTPGLVSGVFFRNLIGLVLHLAVKPHMLAPYELRTKSRLGRWGDL